MPTDAPGYTFLVEVEGVRLAADVEAKLADGYVDNSLNVPDMVVLHFSDQDGTMIDSARFKIGSALRVKVQPTNNEPPITLLDAEVVALETDIDSSGKHLVVRGLDKGHRFLRGARVVAYQNVKPSDVVTQIAQTNGLGVGKIDSMGTVRKHIIQPGISDWDFLNVLAASVGANMTVIDNKLNFGAPVASSTATSSSDSTQNSFVVEFGRNLVSLRATVTSADQVPEVQVRGWDPANKQAVIGTAKAATTSATIDGQLPGKLATTFSGTKLIESNSTIANQQDAMTRAKAIANHVGGSFAELDGVANGNPAMMPGKAVRLVGVGKNFDGKYTLTTTRHHFTPDEGYRTIFTVSNASDRSFYGVTTGAAGSARTGGLMTGVMTAIVTGLGKDENSGMVKVKIPVLDDQLETGWARVVALGAGDHRGTVWLPEVGDEVLVVFGMGNIDEPYVLGGLFNGKDVPDQSFNSAMDNGQLQRRSFTSRSGMVIEMLDKSGEEKVVIRTSDAAQQITVQKSGDKSISIEASGPVTVKTKKDATVEAATGNISVKGEGITIEATTSLELKGATVKITAQGTAELTASGPTSIKGAVVNIN